MSKIINIERHPILKEAVEVCHAIEQCGASEKLTQAVIKASTLANSIDDLLDKLDTKGGRVGAEVMPKIKLCLGTSPIDDILSEKIQRLNIIPNKYDILYFENDKRLAEYFGNDDGFIPPITIDCKRFIFDENNNCTAIEIEASADFDFSA